MCTPKWQESSEAQSMLWLYLWCWSFQRTESHPEFPSPRPVLCSAAVDSPPSASSVSSCTGVWSASRLLESVPTRRKSGAPYFPSLYHLFILRENSRGFVLCFPDTAWLGLWARCFQLQAICLWICLAPLSFLAPNSRWFCGNKVFFFLYLNFLLLCFIPSLSMLEMAEMS